MTTRVERLLKKKGLIPLLNGPAVPVASVSLSTVPPSLNNAFKNARHGKGRVASPHYKWWMHGALLELTRAPPWHVPGAVEIEIQFCRAQTNADLDNLTKGVLDALVKAGRISDDRNVVKITTEFGPDRGTYICARARTIPSVTA